MEYSINFFEQILCYSWHSIIIGACISAASFEVFKIIYRLTLHPLARFPGPKLAAATSLYSAYYDLILTGCYSIKIAELHKIYGPVVRTTPDEVHVHDMECYNQVYKIGTEFDKDWRFYSSSIIQGSLLAISGTAAAKKRRAAYNHYFSKAAVRKVEFVVQEKVQCFLHCLDDSAKSKRYVDLWRGFRCLTADIIIDYAYQEDFGGLSAKDFKHPVIEASDELTTSLQWQWAPYFRRTFGIIEAFINCLPNSILHHIDPALVAVRDFQGSCATSIKKLKQNPIDRDSRIPSIFETLLKCPTEKGVEVLSDSELTAEAVLVLLAGMDTTANALCVGTYNVLKNPQVYRSLRQELRGALPERHSQLSADSLEKLPYLGGIIKESLRLSYGAPGRLPRVVPSSGAIVCGQTIPPGVIISHSIYVYHHDENVFPRSSEFLPERWLGENSKELEQKLLSFSRGTRMCLGMNLAYTELYLTFAHMFRQFEMQLFNTSPHDMEWIDGAVPVYKGHLKAVVLT